MGTVDGVAFEGGQADNHDLTLGSHAFIEGFEEQIVGHNIGDKFDVNVTFPEAYHAIRTFWQRCSICSRTEKD